MAPLELRVLGAPELRAGGRAARLHSAKTLALLAYLALEPGRPHSRERLAALLWGGSPDALARKSLRQALYSLRGALGGPGAACLEISAAAVRLHPHPGLLVDAAELLAPAEGLGQLRRAASLYGGPLLDGLQLDDCPAFEEWLALRRDALEQRALALREELARALRVAGALAEAEAVALQVIADDPLREVAHRELMRVAAARGSREGVARHYRRCAAILARELGAEPSPETAALYRELAEARSAGPAQPAPAASLPALPHVGRDGELAVLRERLLRAAGGAGGLVLVAGPAGSGKSRLLSEARAGAEAAGVAARWLEGRCYQPEAAAPYVLWADLLRPLAAPEWRRSLEGLPPLARGQLARLAPELGPAEAGDDEGAGRLRLLQGVALALERVAAEGPLVIVAEDLHWADPASRELLHYAARRLGAAPILFVGTYRPEEGGGAPLGEAGATLLELGPLTEGEAGALLAPLGPAARGLGPRLHRHSGGNPLLLVETLRALAEAGRLRPGDGGWRLDDAGAALPVPRQVAELLRARLAGLGADQRRALSAAAVLGRACEPRLLRRVAGLGEGQLLAAYEGLRARGLLADGGDGATIAFAHEAVRQAVYDEIAPVQRQVLHRRAAEALAAGGRRGTAAAEEVALHYVAAGDPRALGHLERAAREAAELCAYGRAAELWGRALALLERAPAAAPARRFDMLLALEAALDRQGRRADQGAAIAALLALAAELGDGARQAEAWLRQAGLASYLGRPAEAREAGEQALARFRARGDSAGEARALRELGFLHWSRRDYAVALDYGRAALALHRRLGDGRGEASALHNLAEIHRALGGPGQAVALYEQALSLHWSQQDLRGQGMAGYGLAQALADLGDARAARLRFKQALEACRAGGDRLMESRVHHGLAGLLWAQGERATARVALDAALALSREAGYGPGLAYGLLMRAGLAAEDGDAAVARAALAEAAEWFRLLEDDEGERLVADHARTLQGQGPAPPAGEARVLSHVAMAAGKVYCTFESPLARAR
ncbi:MAG TPA: AAA family ATPase [Chloroflexaceae bacterium]|nr:AAA family ATPase [Chloroflexaceae bacterium]